MINILTRPSKRAMTSLSQQCCGFPGRPWLFWCQGLPREPWLHSPEVPWLVQKAMALQECHGLPREPCICHSEVQLSRSAMAFQESHVFAIQSYGFPGVSWPSKRAMSLSFRAMAFQKCHGLLRVPWLSRSAMAF